MASSPIAIKQEESTPYLNGVTLLQGHVASGALVLANQLEEEEVLISDFMGSDVVKLFVGKDQKMFSVHKDLLFSAGDSFRQMFSAAIGENKKIVLTHEDPECFKLFVEFLYSRRVPSISQTMPPVLQASRVKMLCQLYAFVDKHNVKFEMRNKIMDKIQDGFLIMLKYPETGLIMQIYDHTRPSCVLRKFCVACLVYLMRTGQHVDNKNFVTVLSHNKDVMDDFAEGIQRFVPEQDPRIRHCRGEHGCTECAGNPKRMEGIDGVWPCRFHVHVGPTTNGLKNDDGSDQIITDASCYLWNF